MASGSHFGWPKITFDRISRYFRWIHNFNFFPKMARGGHFGWPKITFDHISCHFRTRRIFSFSNFFYKMAAGGHFGWRKLTFDCISRYFRSIRNFYFLTFFSKWPPAAILDTRFLPRSKGTFLYFRSVATSNMKFIAVFLIKLWSEQALSSCSHNMAASGPFGFPIYSNIDRILPLCVINRCIK